MNQMQRSAHEVIMERILPEFLNEFCSKAGDYGDSWKLLGARGQFSDINRKFWKLYNSIWLGQDLIGEQPDECAKDIIGHCFLLMYILRYEPTSERGSNSSHGANVGAHGAPSDPLAGTVDYPEAREVVAAIRRAAVDESRDGTSLTRIIDAVLALYGAHKVKAEPPQYVEPQ